MSHFVLDVDPEQVHEAGRVFQRLGQELHDRSAELASIGPRVGPAWQGLAADALSDELAGLIRQLHLAAPMFAAARVALVTLAEVYAEAVEVDLPRLNARWQQALADQDRAVAGRRQREADAARDDATAAARLPAGAPAPEPTVVFGLSFADAELELLLTQQALTGQFERLREDLHEQTRRTGRTLAEATVLEVPVKLAVDDASSLRSSGDLWTSGGVPSSTLLDRLDLTTLRADLPLTGESLALSRALAASCDADQARVLLAGLSTSEIVWLTETLPGLAGRLAEPGLSPVPDAAALRDLSADTQLRLALLHPAAIGGLDGAPTAARVAANRVLIRAARDAAWAELEQYGLQAQYGTGSPGPRISREAALKAEARLALYDGLLNDMVQVPRRRPGAPAQVHRQILLFGPAGDGRIAELFGPLDASTRNIAVFVPGTGQSMDDWNGFKNKVVKFHDRLPPDTAVIAWLGTDMPDHIGRNAPSPSYADAGAPRLRDFVAGLDTLVPAATTTVLGHSYGGAQVGAAEREGMRADRVVHIASAGTSLPLGASYPHTADRYAMVNLDDEVQWTSGVSVPPIRFWHEDLTTPRVGHGGGPEEEFTRLDTGAVVADGQSREGAPLTRGHNGYFDLDSDAFENIRRVIVGEPVGLYEERSLSVDWTWREGADVVRDHPSQHDGYRPKTRPVP